MIFRRIAHHLQQQQWTAVLVELAIVVLGVFLGFQATDWANERADRTAEARHLEEIADDLRADDDRVDRGLRLRPVAALALNRDGVAVGRGLRRPGPD